MTTATLSTGKTLEILPCLTVDGWLVRIDGDCYYVRDCLTHYEFAKEDGTTYNVVLHQGVFGCGCPGGRYRGKCKHAEAAKEIMANSW